MPQEKLELQEFIGRGGQKRYRCPDCVFDSYSPIEVAKHWKKSHGKENTSMGGPTLFDADDKPIERTPQVPYSLEKYLKEL